MSKLIVLAALMLLLLSACKKNNVHKKIPGCISEEIETHKKDPLYHIGEITEYVFQGRTVYAFKPDEVIIADASTTIRDSACQIICSIGGYGGPNVTLCNGVNFYNNAIEKRVIWKKR